MSVVLHVCDECGTRYAPAAVCPHCGAAGFHPDFEEDDMAKVTSGGASNAAEVTPVTDEVPEPPGPNALKAELVEHAVEVVGVDPGEAASMTKAQLAETIAEATGPPAE